MIIFIYQNSDFFPLSILRADKNISFFPVQIQLALDLLIYLWDDVKRVNSQGLDGIGLHILVVHSIGITCGVLLLADGFVHVELWRGLVRLLGMGGYDEQNRYEKR